MQSLYFVLRDRMDGQALLPRPCLSCYYLKQSGTIFYILTDYSISFLSQNNVYILAHREIINRID